MEEVNDRTLALKFKDCSNILWNLSKKQTVNLSHTKILVCIHKDLLICEGNSQVNLPGEEWQSFISIFFS